VNAITKTLAAVTLGFAALGAQAGEVAPGDLNTRAVGSSQAAPLVAAVDRQAQAPVMNGALAVGDLGAQPVSAGTAPRMTMAGGRVVSQFAIGA